MAKVTDPALLAQLEGGGGPVTDPALLAALDEPAKPQPPGFGEQALNMVSRGLWALPGLAGLDSETAQAIDFALRDPQKLGGDVVSRFKTYKQGEIERSRRVDAASPVVSGLVRGVASMPGEALTWALAPQLKLAQGAKFLEKAATYGPRLGLLSGASEYGSTASRDPGERAAGAATAAVAGALLGGGMAGALPNPAALAPAKTLAERLQETATNQGRKVLTGNAAPMSTRKPLSEEAVQAAYDAKAIRPFGTVEKAAERLKVAREVTGDEYARIVSALEAQGVTGPDATALAVKLLDEAKASADNTLGSPKPGLFEGIADELGSKPTDPSGRLALSQAENMKRTLQRAAQGDYVKEGRSSLTGEARMDIASRLRQAVEDEVTAQASKAPAEAAAFEPVKRRLGALIEASTAADRGAARAANRQQFGLGSKVLAGGALASGNVPGAAATLVGATALRNRGPATVGAAANAAAKLLRKAPTRTRPASVTPEVEALLEFLRSEGVLLRPATAGAGDDK